MSGIGIVVAILVTLVAVLIPWLPTSASEEMDRIVFVYWFATVICIGIFALVAAVIVYAVLMFRAAPDDEADGPSIHGHTGLEIAWTVVPAILVVAIGILSAVVLSQNGNAGPNPLAVKVFAQQFAWRFEYPDQDKLRSPELVLPVGRSAQFEFESADVIHSFWIPEMGQKQDVVPGIVTKLVVTPKREGTFSLVCTELCGLGHATMRAPVRVLSQAKFAAWVKEQQQPSGGGENGAELFASAGCGGCHAFAPAGTDAAIGPKLDDLAAAAQRAGEPVDAFVEESIIDPGKVIASGYADGVMPKTYGESLSAGEIAALVEYLTGAKQ
jgi:cytochrome c oxidase subunit 2